MLRLFPTDPAAGSRTLAPLANRDFAWFRHSAISARHKLLAAGEHWGDKLRSAPEQNVPAEMLAQIVTGMLIGVAFAPRRQTLPGAVVGAAVAVGAAYLSFEAHKCAMRRLARRRLAWWKTR